ncbi:HAD-IIB family hydrolase [Patescibacteria group bacterium]|nr:HAD-IIB family hydrolase [Patescibacteria group bacterium]MBU1501039.1 HAD-IIB family hydrolase [Patescibacteria group bacterium]MBU2080669.1 HAD-IIB family hydrolase [Patescibacteria group bacterium]MBU2124256.1 HAD-IIB family hydrolase [Patescibacteria group bacterium]MBU2194382.1 HAD-IIB family hydrolase [Patescibacteria group bacterium]
MKYRSVIFDLDETLAESKQPMSEKMAGVFALLLSRVPVAVISGGKFSIMLAHVANRLPEGTATDNLYILPTCGAALYEYKNESWHAVYEETLSDIDMEVIERGIERAVTKTELIDLRTPSHGERIERRGSQVTLSALGQTAPLSEKVLWDPERTKRTLLHATLSEELPQFSVKTGGTTSFDITKPGIDKAYGVTKFSEHVGIPVSEMLYVGDALFPGGNDAVVIETGISTYAVTRPDETYSLIEELLTT